MVMVKKSGKDSNILLMHTALTPSADWVPHVSQIWCMYTTSTVHTLHMSEAGSSLHPAAAAHARGHLTLFS